MKAFSDIFRSQICIQVGAPGGFPSICICSKDRFGHSRLCSLRHRRAAQGGASGGKQKACVRSPAWQALHPQTGALWGVYSVSTQRLGGGKLLVGKAGRAIPHMDDAAAGKAVLFQQMLHDLVVGVGVGTQALAVLHAPVQHGRCHALVLSGRCQTVHRSIGQGIVQPLAVLNSGVGGSAPRINANTASIWPLTT